MKETYDLVTYRHKEDLPREKLRAEIKLGQDYTSDHELWEHIGWIQLMRFTSQPTDEFTKYIRQIRATDFPKITNPKIELLTTTSKTLASGKYQVIKTFTDTTI